MQQHISLSSIRSKKKDSAAGFPLFSAHTLPLKNVLKSCDPCNCMPNLLLITIGKTISKMSVALNRGNGSTWPGHIALKGNKNFIQQILSSSQTKIIIVAGTN